MRWWHSLEKIILCVQWFFGVMDDNVLLHCCCSHCCPHPPCSNYPKLPNCRFYQTISSRKSSLGKCKKIIMPWKLPGDCPKSLGILPIAVPNGERRGKGNQVKWNQTQWTTGKMSNMPLAHCWWNNFECLICLFDTGKWRMSQTSCVPVSFCTMWSQRNGRTNYIFTDLMLPNNEENDGDGNCRRTQQISPRELV